MYIQTIETLYTLREGILDAPELADLASVLGWKYPAFRGGGMRYVQGIGPEKFEATRQDLERKYSRRFAIPASGTGKETAGSAFHVRSRRQDFEPGLVE